MSKLLAGAILYFHVFDSDARLHAVGGMGGIFTDSYEREKTVHIVWEARVISGDDYHRERSHQHEYLEDQHLSFWITSTDCSPYTIKNPR
jgi:hypothetical protein